LKEDTVAIFVETGAANGEVETLSQTTPPGAVAVHNEEVVLVIAAAFIIVTNERD